MNHQKTVVFCLPGSSFSGRFLECWTSLLGWCLANGILPVLSRKESCNVYYVRSMLLGGDIMKGPGQKPFDGKVKFDFLMWIDSDILFTPQQFARLLSHDKDIVSGLYLMDGGQAYAAVKDWDEEYFAQHGYFNFLTPKDSAEAKDLLEIAYCGMGFMLVKRRVFESLEYPWFKPLEKRIGNMVDFTMEDCAFCLRAREAGFKVHIDPQVIVGHEKRIVL